MSELEHYGIKGQRWYHRRYQNPDGSLAPEGRIHYGYKIEKAITKEVNKEAKIASKRSEKIINRLVNKKSEEQLKNMLDAVNKEYTTELVKDASVLHGLDVANKFLKENKKMARSEDLSQFLFGIPGRIASAVVDQKLAKERGINALPGFANSPTFARQLNDIARAYSQKSGKSLEEINKLLDASSFKNMADQANRLGVSDTQLADMIKYASALDYGLNSQLPNFMPSK